MNITLKQIQIRLAEALRNSKLTQKELASQLGICQSNISHYISGDKMPAIDTLANICKILKVDTNYILFQD